jgi:hypothetical protein
MIRKTLIALAAAGALATGFAATATTAQAKTFVDVNVDLGGGSGGGYGGGYDDGYDSYGGYDDGYGYGYGCGFKWVTYKQWNPWHTAFRWKHKKVYYCY